jgi:hypothetical protein
MYGHNIERNLRRRLDTNFQHIEPLGPYPEWLYPKPGYWDPKHKSLLLWGKPGTFKTSFALYYMKHMGYDPEYIKGASHERGKTLSFKRPFVWDELNARNARCVYSNSKELTDVERGGEIECRTSNYVIPPGLPRIFVSNREFAFYNTDEAVFGRRLVVWPERVSQDSKDIEVDLEFERHLY